MSCFLQGKTFSIWKLNDLHNLEVFVSLLLFGDVNKEHWKTEVGTVIGLLNANPMKQKDGYDGVSGRWLVRDSYSRLKAPQEDTFLKYVFLTIYNKRRKIGDGEKKNLFYFSVEFTVIVNFSYVCKSMFPIINVHHRLDVHSGINAK